MQQKEKQLGPLERGKEFSSLPLSLRLSGTSTSSFEPTPDLVEFIWIHVRRAADVIDNGHKHQVEVRTPKGFLPFEGDPICQKIASFRPGVGIMAYSWGYRLYGTGPGHLAMTTTPLLPDERRYWEVPFQEVSFRDT
jgi:hypothetical protein